MYLTLKWIHILAAIIGLGTNLTYSIWLTRVNRHPDSLLFILRTVKILDDRMANPAYVLSLLSGLGMVFVSGMSFSIPWLSLSLGLYVVVVILGLFGYTPILNRQIWAVESGDMEVYTAVARRGALLGIALGILVVAITFLMVVKPPLWG
jgi:uncharacterized membrane protein